MKAVGARAVTLLIVAPVGVVLLLVSALLMLLELAKVPLDALRARCLDFVRSITSAYR